MKNIQKIVISNLARLCKTTIEKYINESLGKEKTINELTQNEATQVIRASRIY